MGDSNQIVHKQCISSIASLLSDWIFISLMELPQGVNSECRMTNWLPAVWRQRNHQCFKRIYP